MFCSKILGKSEVASYQKRKISIKYLTSLLLRSMSKMSHLNSWILNWVKKKIIYKFGVVKILKNCRLFFLSLPNHFFLGSSDTSHHCNPSAPADNCGTACTCCNPSCSDNNCASARLDCEYEWLVKLAHSFLWLGGGHLIHTRFVFVIALTKHLELVYWFVDLGLAVWLSPPEIGRDLKHDQIYWIVPTCRLCRNTALQ